MNYRWIFLVGLSVFGGWAEALAEPVTSVSVELAGGSQAGSYALTSSDTNCMLGMGDADSWETTLGDEQAEPGALGLFVLSAAHVDAATTGTADFSLFVGMGAYGSDGYSEYALEPAKANGSGTLTFVKTDRQHVRIDVDGTTAKGVALHATLTCNDVMDVSGRGLSDSEFAALKFGPDAASPTGSVDLSIGDAHYTVKTGAESSCQRDVYQPGDFWYEYYGDNTHTDLTLITNDFAGAASGISSFGFGIDLSPVHEDGDSGTLTAALSGNALTLTFDAQTAEGSPVRGTIVCTL